MGGLVAINGMGVLPARAFTEKEEKNTSRSFFNKVDKSDAKKIGGGSTIGVLGTALVWAIKEFATKKNKQHAELYELLLPDLVEHLPDRAIPYLKAVYQYLSYRNEYLQKNPGDVVINDLSDNKFIALAENVLVEVALLAGKDLGLQITPTIVRQAIEKNGRVGTAEYSLSFSSGWKDEKPKYLKVATLLDNVQVPRKGQDQEYQLSYTYYPSGLFPLETGHCKGEYQSSLFKALKLIENHFLPDETITNTLCLGFTPDYGLNNSMFNY